MPWVQCSSLQSVEFCRVVSLSYNLAEPPAIDKTYVHMKLERIAAPLALQPAAELQGATVAAADAAGARGGRQSRSQTQFDLIYSPGETEFLVLTAAYARSLGAAATPPPDDAAASAGAEERRIGVGLRVNQRVTVPFEDVPTLAGENTQSQIDQLINIPVCAYDFFGATVRAVAPQTTVGEDGVSAYFGPTHASFYGSVTIEYDTQLLDTSQATKIYDPPYRS